MKKRPSLVYYNRSMKDMFLWICLGILFGGIPLLVYFTAPGAKVANLVLAGVLGLPFLILSLRALGRTTVILVDAHSKKLRYVKSLYHKRQTREVDFSSVTHVEWLSITLSGGSGGRGRGWTSHWNEIHVCLENGERFVLQDKDGKRAELRAKKLGAVIGVPAAQGSTHPA